MLSEKILELSTLSNWCRLKLEAAVSSQYNEVYNCYKCIKSQKIEANRLVMQERKGCLTKQNHVVAATDDGIKFYMCPGRFHGVEERDLIRAYHHYSKHNQLPQPGSIYFQSSKTIEAFDFIEQEINKNEHIKAKRENDEAKRKAKGRR